MEKIVSLPFHLSKHEQKIIKKINIVNGFDDQRTGEGRRTSGDFCHSFVGTSYNAFPLGKDFL